MSGPGRFRSREAERLLARASASAAAPASVHFVAKGRETVRVAGTGSCEACRAAAAAPYGKKACRKSREAAAALALKRTKPVPFVCHLGLACVSVAVAPPDDESGYVLTIGPIVPGRASYGLPDRVTAALYAVGMDEEESLPSLDDLSFSAPSAVAAVAAWTREAFLALPADDADELTPAPARRRAGTARIPAPALDPYQSSAIAAALVASDSAQVRALVKIALDEGEAPPTARRSAARARAVALAAAVLEAAARAGLDTAGAWDGFDAFVAVVREAQAPQQLARAVLDVLRPVSRRVRSESGADQSLAAINRILLPRLGERIMLEEIARELGQHPSAVSHRLRRKFNMSFTEYIGRLRVDEAKRLLRTTQFAVTECARRVGVNDPANFTRLFRKYENMTPLEYRKKYGRTP